ncbi:MAG TPA: C25 family cysteine peptidase [Pyrinomonadaceae bacterium]|nr:C25 family cysteine peptidase [Pyrinomonadaceae bacterium]
MRKVDVKRAAAAAALLLAAAGLAARLATAQHATPAVDGTIGPAEYGNHADGQNAKSNGGTTWYVTWDDANLYVGITGANVTEGAVLYLDRHPVRFDSGTNADGSQSGQTYDNTNFSSLPFRADFVAYFKDEAGGLCAGSSYREYRTADGAGGWGAQTTCFGAYASTAGTTRELSIPWPAVTGAGRPAAFNFFGYLTSPGGFVYGEVPPENPDGFIGTAAVATRFYRVADTDNGESTRPFSQNMASASTFVVNSTGDSSDLSPGDGVCATGSLVGTPPVVECTLRAAIQEANAVASADTIEFLIPAATDAGCNPISGVCTIKPLTALPDVTQPTTVDGYSQPGSAENTLAVGDDAEITIELNGTDIVGSADGLRFTAGDSRVEGLAVYSFPGDGFEFTTVGRNTVSGNFVGHTSDGAVPGVGNQGDGVRFSGVGSNTVGGAAPAARNLIASNFLNGVRLEGAGASSNAVQGNYVGTDRTGTQDFGNTQNGVFVTGPSNQIGGSTGAPGQGAGNVISGNTLAGVHVSSGGNSTAVQGNLVGLAAGGNIALGNAGEAGVYVTGGAAGVTVGGATADLRNVISANAGSVNTDGVEINASSANAVQGNYIGTDINGALDRGNGGDGVRLASGSTLNAVGGPASAPGQAPGNVIAGNASDGVEINTGTAAPTNNTVQGNLVGVNAAGTAALRNDSNGVLLADTANNLIGGSSSSARNVIVGGTGANSDGVDLQNGDGNTVAGNYIGLKPDGTGSNASAADDFGAGQDGVRLTSDSDNNIIGGTASPAGTAPGNVIAGHASNGVEIASSTSTGNGVRGNLIGTQADGATAYANGEEGVLVNTAPSNTVGGAGGGLGNVISGNGGDGVRLNASSCTVQGNLVGLRADGSASLANAGHGVHVLSGSTNTVGGTAAGAANTIAFNGGDGVYVSAGAGNQIRRNSIHSNTGLGIDLGPDGATPNDVDDPDAGANNLQNFPVITSATTGSTVISGTLNSTPSTAFTVEFFSSATPDPTAQGEGQTFLDSITVTTDAGGDATFTHTAAASVPAGHVVTATATNPSGDTSEFSKTRQVVTPTAARLRAVRATAHEGGVVVEWQTSFEADNLGFNLYREEGGRREPVNPSLVAGSALVADAALTAGHSYVWLDRGGTPRSLYYLEDVDTSGARTLHGPFWPRAHAKGRRVVNLDNSPLLEQLGAPAAERSEPAQRQLWPELTGSGGARSEVDAGVGSGDLPAGGTSPDLTAGGAPSRDVESRAAIDEPQTNSDEPRAASVSRGAAGRGRAEAGGRAPALPEVLGTRGSGEAGVGEPQVYLGPEGDTPAGRQRELAAGPAVKLSVRRRGWHRVTRAQLEAAGLSRTADPARLQLYADGSEVAVRLDAAAWLAGAGALEFYGAGLDTPSTDARVYWLVEGAGPGRRVAAPRPPALESPSDASGGVSPGGADDATVIVSDPTLPETPRSFTYTLELKERLIYFSSLRNGEAENFFGRVVNAATPAQTLDVRHIDRQLNTPSDLRVALQGVTNVAHVVAVELNGTLLGSLRFDGRERAEAQFRLSPSLLREGTNDLRLTASGGPSDVSLTDYVRLTYPRLYRAEADRLWFPSQRAALVRVGGFTTADVRVVDVTDPSGVEELAALVQPDPAGGFAATVQPRAGHRLLLAFTGARIEAAAGARANRPSDLLGAAHAADYLVITREELRDALAPLAARRAAEGLAVEVVDVEDIFDEFSFGAHSPQAVRDFLAAARAAWAKAPRYLLLAGDGSYDPRNYLGRGSFDLVPAKLVDTEQMEAVSDDWFADFDDDGLADLSVGRLPVRTPAEAEVVAGKIAGHQPAGARRSLLLVSDRRGADGFDFEAATASLAPLVPGAFEVERVDRGAQDAATVRSQIVAAVNEGQWAVNYLGHGSVNGWTGEGLLRSQDAAALSNGGQLPFFVLMTCLNGHFADPALDGLGEALLKAGGGGALAAWGSTAMTEPEAQAAVNRELYRLLFGGPVTLGDAVRRAKSATADRDVRRTWVLLGDPATRMQ